MNQLAIIIVLMLAGCSTELPSPGESKNPGKNANAELKGSENESELESEDDPDEDDPETSSPAARSKLFSKYLKLKAQNDQLCLRVQKQRVQCPLMNPLVADDSDKVLGCVAGVNANSVVNVSYKMNVTPPSGYKIYLSTKGGAWRTNELGAGSDQVVEWRSSRNSKDQLRAPKLLELNDLLVNLVSSQPEDSSKNRVSEFGEFELRVNNEVLFTKQQLTFRDNAHQVNMSKLDSYLSRPECVVPADEIDALLQKAIENFSEPSESAKIPNDLSSQYSRETSRNQGLRLALSGPEKLGCWAFSKIEKLEVRIEGGSANKKLVKSEAENERKDSGNPTGFTFNFGNGITHSVAEEKGIFKPGGGFVTDAFAGRTIQELQLLSIKKQGVSYDSQEFRKSKKCGLFGLSTCHSTRYKIYETNIKNMATIKILVNDQVIYENNNAKFTFDSKHRKWPKGEKDENIQNNAKFREMMRLSSCPAG